MTFATWIKPTSKRNIIRTIRVINRGTWHTTGEVQQPNDKMDGRLVRVPNNQVGGFRSRD